MIDYDNLLENSKSFCITIKDNEELKSLEKYFLAHNHEVEFYKGINIKNLVNPKTLNHHQIGCALSHLSVWEIFQKTDKDYLIVFEDDVTFCKDYVEEFKKYLEQVPEDWDIIYPGYCIRIKKESIKVGKNVYKDPEGPLCTQSYIVNRNAVKNLIQCVKGPRFGTNEREPLDGFMKSVISRPDCRLNCYTFVPPLNIQLENPVFYDEGTYDTSDYEHLNYETRRPVISVRRDGGFGDMLMIFTLLNSMYKKGYTIDFRCSKHWNHEFINLQEFISNVSDNFNKIDIDLYDTEHDEDYNLRRTNTVFNCFKAKLEKFLPRGYLNKRTKNKELKVEKFELKLIKRHEELVKDYLKELPKPIILINTRATVLNRSLTQSCTEELGEKLSEIGTVINIQNEKFLKSEKVINIFKDILPPDISILACLIKHSELLITTNTSTLHFANCMEKNVLSIDQTFETSKLNIFDNPNFTSFKSDLPCLFCEQHGSCPKDEKVDCFNRKDNNGCWPADSKFPECSSIDTNKVVEKVKELLHTP